MPEERRIDAEDKTAYTWDEINVYYKGKYSKKEVAAYWETLKVAKAKKGKGGGRDEKPEPKANAKVKAKAKETAQAKSGDDISSKEDFAKFILKACKSTKTTEYRQLYSTLLQVFVDGDQDFSGRIPFESFDTIVDQAARFPRRFGFAPTASEMYKTADERKRQRKEMFKEMDADNSGTITFDEWFTFCYKHIQEKAKTIDLESTKLCMDKDKDHFKSWVISACKSRTSPEYKELYAHLMGCFVAGDRDRTGTVTVEQFDRMIDIAAKAPRKFGYAPASKEMFKDKAEKLAARTKMFEEMDTDKNGTIAFDEWLDFSYAHICEKAKTLDDSLSGKPPAK